jgi:hypothetical protein
MGILTYYFSSSLSSSFQDSKPYLSHTDHFGVYYFLYYKHLMTFLLMTLLPSLGLVGLNSLIFRRLQNFKAVSVRLGREERKTVRATISLIAIVIVFVICHSVKVVVNGYQVVQVRHYYKQQQKYVKTKSNRRGSL